jgi:hypothetical protein
MMEPSVSISKSTINAVQKAGAAIFEADTELRAALKVYSEKVTTAVGREPFNIGNDAMFENMKSLARFSQTVGQIEMEMQKVHAFLSGLAADEPQPIVLALAPPLNLEPTDVVVKAKSAKAIPKKRGDNTDVKASLKAKSGPKRRSSNATKLFAYLEANLKRDDFTAINQTSVSAATGIPLGSMTASLKRLVETGLVQAGTEGRYKLM